MAEVSRAQRVSTSRRGAARGIVIDGADVVAAAFEQDAARIRRAASQVVVSYARMAGRLMREHTHSDRIRKAVTSDEQATSTPTSVYADAGPDPRVSNQAFIGRFLEHGTPQHPPFEFAAPAANEVAGPFSDELAKLLGS